jgi:hypothetical protein
MRFSIPFLFVLAWTIMPVFLGFGTDFNRSVTDFKGVVLKIPANVEWTGSGSPICVLTCSDQENAKIIVEMEGSTLVIRSRDQGWNWGVTRDPIKIRLSSSLLEKVVINGSGDFAMKSTSKTPEFQFQINGSGDLKAMVETEKCIGSINGSGDVRISGKTNDFSCDIRGSGDVEALSLAARKVEVDIAGSGDAKVQVSENLQVKIAGSGDVSYKGDPKTLNQKVSGSGELRKL